MNTMIVSKDADEGQLDGLWVSIGTTIVRRATTFAPELIAVSITASIHPPPLSLSLSLSVLLAHSHCNTAILHRIELPTTVVTHDVVDTLNQRGDHVVFANSLLLYLFLPSFSLPLPPLSLSLSQLDI